MRPYAAAAALLAATVPTSPASATHDLVPFCAALAPAPPAQDACLRATFDNSWVQCSGDAVFWDNPALEGRGVVVFFGAAAYMPQATQIRIVCHQDGGPGTAAYEFTSPGPLAVGVPAVRPVTVADWTICTRWDAQFEPGNSWGYPPNVWISSGTYCYELSDLGQ